MNKHYFLIVLFLVSRCLLSQVELAQTTILDDQVTEFLYLRYEMMDDSLNTASGVRLDYAEIFFQGKDILFEKLFDRLDVRKSEESAIDSSLYLQYVIIDNHLKCGVARFAYLSPEADDISVYTFGCMQGDVFNARTEPKREEMIWYLIGELSPVGLRNIRRESVLKEINILSEVNSCINIAYGKILDLDCLSKYIFSLPREKREQIFLQLNTSKS